VIPALPQRRAAESLGVLRGHPNHKCRQRRLRGRREGLVNYVRRVLRTL